MLRHTVGKRLVVCFDVVLLSGSICNDATCTTAARIRPALAGCSCIDSAFHFGYPCTNVLNLTVYMIYPELIWVRGLFPDAQIRRQLALGAAVLNGGLPLGVQRPGIDSTHGSVPGQVIALLPPASSNPQWHSPQGTKLAQASSLTHVSENSPVEQIPHTVVPVV